MFVLKILLIILSVPVLYKAITLENFNKAFDYFSLEMGILGILYLMRLILKKQLKIKAYNCLN